MNKIKSTILLLLTVFLFQVNMIAQNPMPSVQPGFRETVWVRSDRTLYIPGDRVCFSATLLETDSYQSSSLSRIIRMDIIDSQGNIIIHKKFELTDGSISAELDLPGSMESGWYFLRGYTNWMRNFPASNRCMLPFRVVDLSDNESILSNPGTDNETEIRLIPEQGRLRDGVPDNLIIHATSVTGGAKAVKGILGIPGSGETYPFETGPSGWSMIKFNGGSLDGAEVVLGGRQGNRARLTSSEYSDDAPFISIEEYFNNISVKVSLESESGEAEYKLLVHSSGTIFWYGSAQPVGNSLNFYLPAENVPRSVAQFMVLDQDNNIIAKKLWVNKSLFSQLPEIVGEPSTQPRSEYQARVIVPSMGASGSSEHLDIMVKKDEPGEILDTWLPGLPGWPADWSIPADPEALKAWMTANSFPDEVSSQFFPKGFSDPVIHGYDIHALALEIEKEVRFLPETRGLTITGTVTHTGSGEPVQNIAVGATILNDNSFYADKTFASGRFHLSFPTTVDNLDMIIAFLEQPEPDWVLKIDPDYDNSTVKVKVPEFGVSEEELQYLSSLNINRQINDVFTRETAQKDDRETVTVPDRSKAFFGQPDITVIVDNFIKLPNIREVIFEVVPNVFVRKKGDRFYMVIIGDLPIPEIYKTVFLLDGVPLTDFNTFLELPPDRIKRIEVKNKLFIHGNMAFGGAVNFVSTNGDLAGLNLPEKSKLFTLETVSAHACSVNSLTDSTPSNIPVLSNTLEWDRHFNSFRNGLSFTTNDNLGNWLIRVCGFNKSGQWVYGKSGFSIEFSKEENQD